MAIDTKTLALAKAASSGTIVKDWQPGENYKPDQLTSYLGKLYKALNPINGAIVSPDIDPGNYKVYSGSSGGSSGSNSVKFPGFTPNNLYSYGETIVHDNNLLTAKSSFTSTDAFNLNNWNVVSDMHKTVYDINGDAMVDKAEHALVADMAIETKLVQTWKQNTPYTTGQNLVYNNETYTVTNNFTSGTVFDKTNLLLSATGNHNGLTNIQGGKVNTKEFYHIEKSKHDIVNNMSDSLGELTYNGNILGNMKKSIYDANMDGIVDKATTLDGLTSTVIELNYMHGVTSNIQAQINAISSVGNFTGSVPTYADIATTFISPKSKDMVIVVADETHAGASTIYLYSTSVWSYAGSFSATIRDFLVNPIDVISESTGMYSENRIDPAIARKTDIQDFPNAALLSTYTQTESDLVDVIANKHSHANQSLLSTYTQTNTDIGNAINKAHAHSNKNVIDYFTEDGLGNPLYKGNPIIGSGGGSGISDLSLFNTADLIETTNFRYVTDVEKANIQNLTAVVATQATINTTLSNIATEIPSDASSVNKLVTNNTVNTKMKAVKLLELADINHTVQPNSFLVTNSTGTQVTYLSSIKSMIKIQKVTDKDGVDYIDVPNLKFNNLTGLQHADGSVDLSLPSMFTTDLQDMPDSYDNGKVLVANGTSMNYELKDIATLTNSKENYNKTIGQTDWSYDPVLKKYTVTIEHNLNSKNLIVGFYDVSNFSINNISWGLLDGTDVNKIIVESQTNNAIRVVINCSQGAVGNGTGSGGSVTVTTADFIDDTRTRTDKAYSSTKLTTLLGGYATKSTVYTKEESNSVFSSKINEHIHTNISSLNKITEDINGNMYFGGKKILTNLQPYTYQKHWDKQEFASSALLVDINTIFNTNTYNAIMESELTIKNNVVSVNEIEDAKSINQLHLVVLDNSLVVLDVLIAPGSTQKYILGISPNIQVMINGKFSANYYLTAY